MALCIQVCIAILLSVAVEFITLRRLILLNFKRELTIQECSRLWEVYNIHTTLLTYVYSIAE